VSLFAKILRVGLATEPLEPDGAAAVELVRQVEARTRRLLGRALAIREVDAGSCNGCELEISGLTGPVYDSERFGIHFVASPRHADLLLVTGPVTRNMEVPLRKTYEATPDPKLVVAVGDCARTCGVFRGSYAVAGSVDQVVPVDVFVAGCPPEPADILRGILTALDRLSARPSRR
jgi:Ni,Fe-hydrogenase III small subunit